MKIPRISGVIAIVVLMGWLVFGSIRYSKPKVNVQVGIAVFRLDGHVFTSEYKEGAERRIPIMEDGAVFHARNCPCGWRKNK